MIIIERVATGMDDFYANHPTKSTGTIDYPIEDRLIDLFQHENFENAARNTLGGNAVELVSALFYTPPRKWANGPIMRIVSVDICFNLDELMCLPRRVCLMYMAFSDDIPANCAPTVIRPGSHMLLSQHYGSQDVQTDHPMNIKELPDLDYADPIPLTGKKGQIAASTTAWIQAGSRNVSDQPRKLLFIAFTAAGINLRLMLIAQTNGSGF